MFSIYLIRALNDNYIWALIDDLNKNAIVIDPGDAIPVLSFLHEHQLTLSAILITHKHHDHTGGISVLISEFPKATVFSNPIEQVIKTTVAVFDNDIITINDHAFTVIAIPGHTLGHVAYYCKPYLFCGDTLFANGCGRIFEGTARQMLESLKKLMLLPDETLVYCAHEYTLSNIQFALHVEPNNNELKKRFEETKKLRNLNKPTVPSTLRLEKMTNPFLRCYEKSVIAAASNHCNKKLELEVDVFSTLREWKNNFN